MLTYSHTQYKRGAKMIKKTLIWGIAIFLIAISVYPLFLILREFMIDTKLSAQYDIHHAYIDEFGFEDVINTKKLTVGEQTIKIVEEKTGLKAPLTPWDHDENVPPGDIVKIHIFLHNEEITTPEEIWLSNRDRGSRYFSWLDILSIQDKLTGEKQLKIIQRLTDDDQMDDRRWKIITVNSDNTVEEEQLNYEQRNRSPLDVRLVNFSGTSLMAMGYYSDISTGIPNLLFPILYPFVTSLIGVIFLLIGTRLSFKAKS